MIFWRNHKSRNFNRISKLSFNFITHNQYKTISDKSLAIDYYFFANEQTSSLNNANLLTNEEIGSPQNLHVYNKNEKCYDQSF